MLNMEYGGGADKTAPPLPCGETGHRMVYWRWTLGGDYHANAEEAQ